MSQTLAPSSTMPLSILLFTTAMNREQSISQFAKELNIGTISLRQFIMGNTQRPRQKTLETLGDMLGLTAEEVRERSEILPYAQPEFSTWLAEQIASRPKFSRARLVREADISDSAIRNYLAGVTLPDAHQAARIAKVFEVDPTDMAAMIVANTITAEGRQLTTAPTDTYTTSTTAIDLAEPDAPPLLHALSTPDALLSSAAPNGSEATTGSLSHDEAQILSLWRQLHPQGRRATYNYIAMLLAER